MGLWRERVTDIILEEPEIVWKVEYMLVFMFSNFGKSDV